MVFHGFVLGNNEFTSIDFPGAALTQAVDINSKGDILGIYQDTDGNYHTFVLSHGAYASVDYPDAVWTGGLNIAVGISPRSNIVGQYRDVAGITHGFVLDATGYTTIDIPGYSTTVLTGINPRGDMVGRARGTDGRDVAFGSDDDGRRLPHPLSASNHCTLMRGRWREWVSVSETTACAVAA
jgi:hypothetical protein